MPEKELPSLGSIKLLLVDDEKAFTDVLAKRLTKREIDVTVAYSGTEAIQTLRKQDFDVAVLDLKMEDMDGIEVLNIFMKMDSEMPVIILTGHGSEQSARDGLAKGAFDYLTKPYAFEALFQKVQDAAQKRILKK